MGKKHKITEPDEIWKEMASTSPLPSELIIRELKKKGNAWPWKKNHLVFYLHKDQMESGETGIFSPVDHIEPVTSDKDSHLFYQLVKKSHIILVLDW